VGALSVNQAMTDVRAIAQDANGAVGDATLLRILNEMNFLWVGEWSPRVTIASGATLAFTSANQYVKKLSLSEVEILYAMSVLINTDTFGIPMERIEYDEMLRLHDSDQSDSGRPTKWCVQRVAAQPTSTAGSHGLTNLLIHPRSNGNAIVSLAYRSRPTELAAGATMDLSDEECRIVVRMAAAEVSRLNYKSPQFIDGVIALLPDQAQVQYRKTMNWKMPKVRPDEDVI